MLETYEIQDAQPRLRELVWKVNKGVEVLLTDGCTPLARLVPAREVSPEPSPEPRIAGLHLGMGWMSDDFDAPLPDEFWVGEN